MATQWGVIMVPAQQKLITISSPRRAAGLLLGPLLFLVALLGPCPPGMTVEAQRVAAVALLMATWWVTEAIPIPATSLLPVVLYPLLGIMDAKAAPTAFAHPLIFLFMGGFFLAMAMQQWNLHTRIALHVIKRVGLTTRRIVLGFMCATAFLSMWISNTATAMMMLPIALAVAVNVECLCAEVDQSPSEVGREKNFCILLMLGIAYSASIGGIGTLIGTPPNLVFAAAVSKMYGRTVDFATWMAIGIPLVLVFLPLAWLYLTGVVFPLSRRKVPGARQIISRQLRELGPPSRGERVVLVVFVLTALCWVFRAQKTIFGLQVPGLDMLFPKIHDATIAVAAALCLFAFPVDWKRKRFGLNWEWAVKIPWGTLLLFGGGLALAEGFQSSGLAPWIGDRVLRLQTLPPLLVLLVVIAGVAALTEFTSNTATAAMLMPTLGAMAVGMGHHPYFLMLAACVAASLAFMLPVATPPNAVVYGSGMVRIPQMVKAGIWMNLLGILVWTTLMYTLAMKLFGITLHQVPEWAR
jgi:sodium-dependent dicarboxylate transporter 2/3/5